MSKTAQSQTQDEYQNLQRRHLAMFNKQQQDLILEIVELGAQGRISSNGHAILRGPTGKTMWISRNTGSGFTRTSKLRSDIKTTFDGTVSAEAVETLLARLTGNTPKKASKGDKATDQPQGQTRTTPAVPSQIDEKPAILDYRIEPFMSTTNRMKDGERVVMESDTLEKVVWSDGTVKIKCKFCDYCRDEAKQVIPHLNVHRKMIDQLKVEGKVRVNSAAEMGKVRKRLGLPVSVADKPNADGIIEPDGDKHMPPVVHDEPKNPRNSFGVAIIDRDRCNCHTGSAATCPIHTQEDFEQADRERAAAMADFDAQQNSGMSAEGDYADWLRKQADAPTSGPEDPRIQAIRGLLGTDPRVVELEAQIELLQVQLLEAEDRANSCSARADQLQSSLDAVHDMLGDITTRKN